MLLASMHLPVRRGGVPVKRLLAAITQSRYGQAVCMFTKNMRTHLQLRSGAGSVLRWFRSGGARRGKCRGAQRVLLWLRTWGAHRRLCRGRRQGVEVDAHAGVHAGCCCSCRGWIVLAYPSSARA